MKQPLGQITEKFVFEYGQSSREFHAVVSFLVQGSKQAKMEYRMRAFEDPQFFYSAFMELVKYEQSTETALDYAFKTRPTQDYENVLAPTLPEDLLCSVLKEKDLEGYLKTLNSYRLLINEGSFKRSSITKVYNTLNDLSINCAE